MVLKKQANNTIAVINSFFSEGNNEILSFSFDLVADFLSEDLFDKQYGRKKKQIASRAQTFSDMEEKMLYSTELDDAL